MDEAKQLCHQLRQLLKLAGMELRKWRSNSQEFLNSIPEELRESSDLIITDPLLSGKALGIHWDTQGDQLFGGLPSVSSSEVVTKRIIASIAAQVFMFWASTHQSLFYPKSCCSHCGRQDQVGMNLFLYTSSRNGGTGSESCTSSFNHLVRIVAWIKRFCHNCRTSKNQRKLAAMSVDEASAAEKTVLKLIQADVMPELIEADQPPKGHYLAKYQIQHKEGLILICSRVRSDNQPKTYIPLHLKSPGTRAMVDSLHEELHHAGTRTLLAHLAERFHIPNIKRYIKGLVQRCVPCQRLFGQPKHQLMGPLPSSRTEVALPFQSTGVDFAGPFTIRVRLPRSKKTSKAYLVVFICMLTKAVHLEVCLSLSTGAFIQTLRDFCNRRGTPTDLYSDNGSNFLGTRKEIL